MRNAFAPFKSVETWEPVPQKQKKSHPKEFGHRQKPGCRRRHHKRFAHIGYEDKSGPFHPQDSVNIGGSRVFAEQGPGIFLCFHLQHKDGSVQ